MSNKYIHILFVLFLGTAICCKVQNTISSSEIDTTADKYRKTYGHIDSSHDTTIVSGHLKRIYKNGVLYRIGKISSKSKFDDFLEFDSNLRLVAVLSCKGDSCDVKVLMNKAW